MEGGERGEGRERGGHGGRKREKVRTIKDEDDDNQRAERRRLDDDGEGGGAGSQSVVDSVFPVSLAGQFGAEQGSPDVALWEPITGPRGVRPGGAAKQPLKKLLSNSLN